MTASNLLAGLMLLGIAHAQDSLPAFQRVSGLPHAVVLRRIPVDGQWDLAIAVASSTTCDPAPRPCWWSTKDRLGVLLVDRDDPTKLQPLAIEPGPNDDCATRVERFTLQELVLSCIGEKWATYDNQKFVYDIASRKLVSHVSYAPFLSKGVLHGRNGPQFVMTDSHQRLLVTIDPASGEPRVIPTAEVPEPADDREVQFGRFRLSRLRDKYQSESIAVTEGATVYPLPQTDPREWQRARPEEGKNYSHLDLAEIREEIGPHQVENGRLWFGKSFYNSEGGTGVGGFGYFDPATASYHLIAIPEIYAWSVSAILVEQDAIWLALFRRGEYGNDPGGLLRWDRNTQQVRRWDMPSIATSLARNGDGIYMGTVDGIAALRAERVVSYFVDRSAEGQYRMVER
jgi:hypothetical protein